MTDPKISAAFRAFRERIFRGRPLDLEQAFAAGYRAATTPAMIREAFAAEQAKAEAEHAATNRQVSIQAHRAGFENGQREMHRLVLDLVCNRVLTYGQCQARRDGLAENSLNEHEKFKHTREAMEYLAKEIDRIAPKKTLNFEQGKAPDEPQEPRS